MSKWKTPRLTRINERHMRKHEAKAHEKRLSERERAAFALFELRSAVKRGDTYATVFWAKSLARHLQWSAEEAVHDMRRR